MMNNSKYSRNFNLIKSISRNHCKTVLQDKKSLKKVMNKGEKTYPFPVILSINLWELSLMFCE